MNQREHTLEYDSEYDLEKQTTAILQLNWLLLLFLQAIIAGLKARGHDMEETIKLARIGSIAETCTDDCTGADCYIRKCLLAVSDGRKGGAPDGY